MGNEGPYAVVDAKLQSLAQASPKTPSWHDAWTRLGPDSSEEERLAVYDSIRKAGSVPESASFWLVSRIIDDITTRDVGDSLRQYEDRLEEIEETYGFDDGGVWPSGTAPANYQQLRDECQKAWDQLFVRKLDELGEHEMARLFREDNDRFERLSEEGRQYFYGPESEPDSWPMLWLHRLTETVAECMTADSPMGPLGYRYGEEDNNYWQVDIYPTPVELVGGAVDGEVVAPGFSLDVEELRSSFERIDSLNWQSLGLPIDEGPRFVVEGAYQGRNVLLQILAYAPDDEEAGMKLNTT